MVSKIDYSQYPIRAIHIEDEGTVAFKADEDHLLPIELITDLAQRALVLKDCNNQDVEDQEISNFEEECSLLKVEVEVMMRGAE